MLRKGFTLVEALIVIAIIGVLAAIIYPLIVGSFSTAQRSEVSDEVGRLTAIWNLIKIDTGSYPIPESDNNLSWDVSGKNPGLLNDVVEPYSFPISLDRLNEDNEFTDMWLDPIKYVKGDYANRIDKKVWDPAVNLSQDTNKPIGDPAKDIAAESSWNPENKGGFAYIWSYGGDKSDEAVWIYHTSSN